MNKGRRKKINIVVIGGGDSNERDISLMTSRQIVAVLPSSKYNISTIEISEKGKWILRNATSDKVKLKSSQRGLTISGEKTAEWGNIDVAFIALHGKNGEDGKVQSVLELLGIPYTGSGILASALAMNKLKTMDFVSARGILVPKYFALTKKDIHRQAIAATRKKVEKLIRYPFIVKPNESGSSIGIKVVKRPQEFLAALKAAFAEDYQVAIVQEFIVGREFSCGVLGNTNQTDLQALPPIEIVNNESDFFDYNTKYFSSIVEEICPAKIDAALTEKIKTISKYVHFLLGCDGLSRSDFILSRDNNLYFLELNTIPGQTEASLCPKEAVAAGMSFKAFIEKQVLLALKKYGGK